MGADAWTRRVRALGSVRSEDLRGNFLLPGPQTDRPPRGGRLSGSPTPPRSHEGSRLGPRDHL